jgi:3-(3-hydroxy-phenyl)propionate hydroxylase
MRDVANLSWKLPLVARGLAPMELLHGYQHEREPQVRSVISAAIDTGKYICELDPAAAALRDRIIREREATRTVHTAGDLIAPITGTILQGSASAGERFIQPRISGVDGKDRLLDDVTGSGMRLFVVRGATIDAGRAERFARLGGTIHATADLGSEALDAWLAARDAGAVLVRSDFYVFGTMPITSDPNLLLESFLAAVALPHDSEALPA